MHVEQYGSPGLFVFTALTLLALLNHTERDTKLLKEMRASENKRQIHIRYRDEIDKNVLESALGCDG